MIDFGCKRFDLKQIVKCGFGLTRSDFRVMEYFLSHRRACSSFSVSGVLNLNLTTVQKAVKKLFEKGIIVRHQKNLAGGGYVYTYECTSKVKIRKMIKEIIRNWSNRVENEIDKW